MMCFSFLRGRTSLRVASYGGHEKVVQMLIKAGANIEAQDKEYLFFIQRSNGICVFLF